jgi:DNA-binding IclR family transcriptional regulator
VNASVATSAGGRREGVQVIARAAIMLRQLAAEPNGLTLAELVARTGLPRSTVHRIAGTLVDEGFVGVSPSGQLRIGPSLIGLAVASRRDLRREVAPYLQRLSHELRETVDLAVLDGGDVLFIDQYTSRRTLRIVSEIGARFPVHCTANGKALLARLSPEELARVLPARLQRMTPNTITDRRRLLEELEQVRAAGLAYDHEEYTPGIAAVGTTVRDAMGSVAAITIVVPASRFEGREQVLAAALLRTRDDIQQVLSGD